MKGWECPKCGRVYSPRVDECAYCAGIALRGLVREAARREEFDPAKCPCNPALGGSGVCGCILSGMRVT